jgi:hypothetical protein
MLRFDAQHLPRPSNEYVAWIDVMGTKASMGRSISGTANFVFKLHIAAIQQQPSSGVRIYPVMDGFYASSSDQAAFQSFLRGVFSAVADEFISESEHRHQFVIRGGLAYGPVYHGSDVGSSASSDLAGKTAHRDAILLGMPMVQAHLAEPSAPPFGIAVHESARTFAPAHSDPLHCAWWFWKHTTTQSTWSALPDKMKDYLIWCRSRAVPYEYPVERVRAHEELFGQFMALAS